MTQRSSPLRPRHGLAAFSLAALLAMAATAQVSNVDGTAALTPPDTAALAAALTAPESSAPDPAD